jgi:hypothetical protein
MVIIPNLLVRLDPSSMQSLNRSSLNMRLCLFFKAQISKSAAPQGDKVYLVNANMSVYLL